MEKIIIKKDEKTLINAIEQVGRSPQKVDLGKKFGKVTIYLDEHPEGSDRGGYIPYMDIKINGKKVTLGFDEEEGFWML